MYTLHSAFSSVANYLSGDGSLLILATPEIGAGPGVITVHTLPDPLPSSFEHAPTPDPTIPIYNPTMPAGIRAPLPAEVEPIIRTLAPLWTDSLADYLWQPKTTASGLKQKLADQFIQGAHALRAGSYQQGTKMLNGLGPGLTPAGDDFLCGFLWALSLFNDMADVRKAIYSNVQSGNHLVRHFMQAAYEGLFFEHFKNFTMAVCTGDPDAVHHAFQCVRCHGATSGLDTAAGLCWAFLHHPVQKIG